MKSNKRALNLRSMFCMWWFWQSIVVDDELSRNTQFRYWFYSIEHGDGPMSWDDTL